MTTNRNNARGQRHATRRIPQAETLGPREPTPRQCILGPVRRHYDWLHIGITLNLGFGMSLVNSIYVTAATVPAAIALGYLLWGIQTLRKR